MPAVLLSTFNPVVGMQFTKKKTQHNNLIKVNLQNKRLMCKQHGKLSLKVQWSKEYLKFYVL